MKLLGSVFLYLLVLFAVSSEAHAATLYMNPSVSAIHPGDSITLAVRVDPGEDECVNVINAVIEYESPLQPVDISRGQSIVPIWVEEPTIDTANKRITFAGGIPNGYCGRIDGDPRLTNVVLEIIFQAPGFSIGGKSDSPTSSVAFTNETSVLLNDGAGTLAPLQTFGADIFVHKERGQKINHRWNELVAADNQPPETFSVSLESDPSIFGGKYFIVFNTTDKQTGIDHFEVIEESFDSGDLFSWGAETAPWQNARSPYVLNDQSLNSVVRVKALDKAGNEYVASVVPDESIRGMSQAQKIERGLLWAFLGIGVVLVVTLGILLYRRRQRLLEAEEYEYETYDEDE